MIPNRERVNEIIFFWLMHYYNKNYDYDKTSVIMQMYCELTRKEGIDPISYNQITTIREKMLQQSYGATNVEETIWVLVNAGYSLRTIEKLIRKTKDTILRRYNEIKQDERRQYTYSRLLKPEDYICVARYLDAVKEFDFRWITKKH